MLWLSSVVVALCALLLLALLLPVSLSSNLQGRAEPNGSWAIAFGFGIGPLALTAIAALGVAPFVTCHVFGKQLVRLPLSRWLRGEKKKTEASETEVAKPPVNFSRFERSVARFFRALDPVDTVLSWWEKERIFEVKSLVVDVEYSFRDVALTGQILAGLYMLSGVLPDHYEINQTPGWDSEDRVALTADGRFQIWPGRLLVDVVGFVLKQRSKARREVAPASE